MSTLIITKVLPLLFFICQALFFLVLLKKLSDNRRRRRYLRTAPIYEPVIYKLVCAENKREAENYLSKLQVRKTLDREVIRDILLDLIVNLKGAEQERLTDAFERLGYVEEYLDRLDHPSWWVRAQAARRLGEMKSRLALPELVEALHHEKEDVRITAAVALASIGDRRALEPLLESIVELHRLSGCRIMDVLVSFGSAAVEPLLKVLQTGDTTAKLLALDVLRVLRGRRGLNLLANCATSQELEVKVKAIKALGHIGVDQDQLSCLLDAMQDGRWEVRAVAAQALGKNPSQLALDPLARAVNDNQWWVRLNAAEALKNLGEEGIYALKEIAMASANTYARDMATQVLDRT